MRRRVLMCVLAAVWPATAMAQTTPHGYVQAIGGIATTSATDAVLAGGVAVRATDRLDVFGELGHLRNGIWTALEDDLDATGQQISAQIAAMFGAGAPVTFEARVPVWYGLGGVRAHGPQFGRLATYGEAAIGFARLRPEVRLEVGGERLDAEAGRLLTFEEERSELMSALGAGIAFRLFGPVRIEAGYRYSRIYGDRPVNVNRVHAGVGYAF